MTISTESPTPLIIVVGATGLQGGSVINSLASSTRPYRMRGITRNPSKPNAKNLSYRGVEVISCDLRVVNDAAIQNTFRGSTYVFIVTNFWEHLDSHREAAEGKSMVRCAHEVGVKLLLISAVPDVTKASKGELTKAYHFDSKASVVEYSRSIGVPFVEIQATAYMNNLLTFVRPTHKPDGSYAIQGIWSKDARLPLIDTGNDFGLFIQLAIESEEFNKGDGNIISAYAEWLSHEEQALLLSEATRKVVTYEKITEEQARKNHFQAGNMCKFHEFVWASVIVYTDLSMLQPSPQTFRKYSENEDWSSVFGSGNAKMG